MNDYIPLQSSWKNLFLDQHLQYVLNQIQQHEDTLIKLFDAPSNKVIKQLNKLSFWQDLKARVSNQNEIDELWDIWQKTKDLSHLNAKQLLDVLQEHVIPLERHYHLAIDALEKKRIEIEMSGVAKWFNPALDPYLSALQVNQNHLQKVKSLIYDGLLSRALAYRMLNTTSEVDDIVAAVCHKINSFRVLSSSLPIKTPYSCTLNGDRRLSIYDYLQESTQDKDKLYELILAAVLKKGIPAFKSPDTISQELTQIQKFHKKTINGLAKNTANSSYTWLKSFIPPAIRKSGNSTWKAIKDVFVQLVSLFPLLAYLSRLRYALYLSLTLITYHYLVFMLQPVMTIFFGATVFSIIQNFLFYTLALAPIWVLSWNFLVSCKNTVYEFLTQRKKKHIYSALDILTKNQEFIANHLSQVIIDIPNFDIEHTMAKLIRQQEDLAKSKQKLKHFFRGEKIFCKGLVECSIANVLIEIEKQEAQLLAHSIVLASHIALRVGQDIDILQKAIDKQAFTVSIAHQQLEKLQQFVRTFGEKSALILFEQNSNPLYKWTSKIERYLQHRPIEGSLLQPWGGWRVRKDYLCGWETILNGYLADGNKKNTALQLSSLLGGNCQPTVQEFTVWLDALDMGDQKTVLKQKIQIHIFKSLNANTAPNATLLCDQHKELIAKWHEEHTLKIKEAQSIIHSLLNAPPNNPLLWEMDDYALSTIYSLLEGGDIFCYSANKEDSDIKQRKGLAKAYFDQYQGQHSKAIRFLGFFSEEEQKLLLIKIAKNRLCWLLDHLDNGVDPLAPFDETDIELFYDYRLIEANDNFKFASFILESTPFNSPWDQKVETFLNACRCHGLDSGHLLRKYQETNDRIKPFMLHLHESQRKNLEKNSETLPFAKLKKEGNLRAKVRNPV